MIIYNLNVSYFLMIWFIFKICIKTQPENKRKQPQLWLAKGNYFLVNCNYYITSSPCISNYMHLLNIQFSKIQRGSGLVLTKAHSVPDKNAWICALARVLITLNMLCSKKIHLTFIMHL